MEGVFAAMCLTDVSLLKKSNAFQKSLEL